MESLIGGMLFLGHILKIKRPELTAKDKIKGKERISASATLKHYKKKVDAVRKEYKKTPYADWPKAYKNWTTFEMSDHLPIWMELEIDYSDDYLRRFIE